jgi:UDP-glucose 4-epimerase
VKDVVAAVVALMQTPAALGRVFNIGSDQPVSILQLAQKVIELTGSKSLVEFQTYTAAYDKDFEDIRRRVPDLSRLRETVDCPRPSALDAVVRDIMTHRRGS